MSDDAICEGCRAHLVATARPALSVLADERANDDERRVAGDVVTETVQTLRLPPGRLAREKR